MSTLAEVIAHQNDLFRQALGDPMFIGTRIPGKYMMSQGVSALPYDQQVEIILKTRSFNDFDEDNDPHGEHDMGRIQLDVCKSDILWKIDYFDTEYSYGSEDPTDLNKTRRVLTTMLAFEY